MWPSLFEGVGSWPTGGFLVLPFYPGLQGISISVIDAVIDDAKTLIDGDPVIDRLSDVLSTDLLTDGQGTVYPLGRATVGVDAHVA